MSLNELTPIQESVAEMLKRSIEQLNDDDHDLVISQASDIADNLVACDCEDAANVFTLLCDFIESLK